MYDGLGQESEELLEADPFALQSVRNVDQGGVDELVRLVVAEGASGGDDFSDIGLPAGVGIEVEQSVEVFNLCNFEGGVFRHDVLRENLLLLILDDGLAVDSCHRYINSNII